MQKVDNNTSEKIIYSKKEKIIENFGVIGQMKNGCWTSRSSNIKDADANNIKINPNTPPCICESGTSWMLISDSTQSQQVYGCNPTPPSYNQFMTNRQNPPSDSQITPSYSHNTPSYSHNTPSYSHNTPSYEQNTPSYSHNTPSYEQNPPSDSQNTPSDN
jgi:hypothetical protein